MDQRQNAVAQAEVIIENQVSDFLHWLDNRELVPTIRALRDTAERARRHELERAQRSLAKGADPQQVIDELSRALTNKFMHPPSHALNHAADDERDELSALISRLYQIQRPE
jgi:glutamyl-tRNA reductase